MRTRKAFTLIELLVVISIIALIGAGSIALVKFNTEKPSLRAAQQTLITAFEEARMMSLSKNVKSRVLIYRGNDVDRKLRQVGVVYEAMNAQGDFMGWISTSAPALLPENTFFMPPSGEAKSFVIFDEGVRESDVLFSTQNSGSTGAPRVVSMNEFTRSPQSLGEGNGDWYSYEFSPEGLSENPSACILVATGFIRGSNGMFYLKNAHETVGFVVYKTGRLAAFKDYEEIKGNIQRK